MDAREELAQIIDAAFYEHEQGYYLNAESVEYAQADRVLAAGYRKMPDREAVLKAVGDAWDSLSETGPVIEPIADAILALMDGNK